jgi:hypothetical protein
MISTRDLTIGPQPIPPAIPESSSDIAVGLNCNTLQFDRTYNVEPLIANQVVYSNMVRSKPFSNAVRKCPRLDAEFLLQH